MGEHMASWSSCARQVRRRRLCYLGFHRAGLALLVLVAFSIPARGKESSERESYRLDIAVHDESGQGLAARVRVLGSDGRVHPDTLDVARMVHLSWGGYFYADGSAWVDVPPGLTRLTVGRGFERMPHDRWLHVDRDTSVVVVLPRFFDLGQEGWFGGDMHVHSNHGTPHYSITPALGLRVARAEGLSVTHFLDQGENFTGSPGGLSDEETVVYYTYEYRNQAYGHVGLPGLHSSVDIGCCVPPDPAYPMLLDLRRLVVPDRGPMIVLAHPHTTDDYFDDQAWPGFGLGREMPVLEALGGLDAFDVASYSNSGIEDWGEWTDIISSGVGCAPTAGTDADLNYVFSPPPGGFRVYAQQEGGGPLDYDAWLDAVRAGRTFVTNYPLIPDFEVDRVRPGGTIDVQGSQGRFQIRIRALCVLGLRRVSLVADGAEIWSASTAMVPVQTEIDTTVTMTMAVPAMLCARAEGLAGNPHALLGMPVAQTNAVRFTEGGVPRRKTAACGRMLDRLDDLTEFVNRRGGWNHFWEADTVANRIGRARQFYRSAFVTPPGPFSLLTPQDLDTLVVGSVELTWSESIDSEPGDEVKYTVGISPDSGNLHLRYYPTTETVLTNPLLRPDAWYWWKVEATDRGGHMTQATPARRWFYLRGSTAAAESGAEWPDAPRGLPNPSRGPVRIEGLIPPVAIVDLAGRIVAVVGTDARGGATAVTWDGRTANGDLAAPGLYWARGRSETTAARLIRLP
jgi:hypothetical protein